MNYNNKTPIKVTVEGGLNPSRKLELTMDPYSDLSDWIDAFKTILINQTFSEDTVKELFEEPTFDSSDEECELASLDALADYCEDVKIDCKSSQRNWKDEF